MPTQLAEIGPEGQATFEMANLRQKTTNLPFVVWVSQRDNYPHDVRVKVGYTPKAFRSQMSTYGVRPFKFLGGQRLHADDEQRLEWWIEQNRDVLIDYWTGDIAFTEDMVERIKRLLT